MDVSSLIPKVIIGNPESRGMAYDFIPDYRPFLHAETSQDEHEQFYYQGRLLPLAIADRRLLSLCDGRRSVFHVCREWANLTGLDVHDGVAKGFERLKWARGHGLVVRDNAFTTEALFLRLRELQADGSERVQWLYLPPFAYRVLTLCSGSFTCTEMARIISSEQEGPTAPSALAASVQKVQQVVEVLIDHRVATWLDDSTRRRRRLEALFDVSAAA